ncbi:MAG: M48 family metallopeptidase [Bacteroidota bacterium]
MKKFLFSSLLIITLIIGCTTVPISNRKQFILVGDNELNAMALTSYKSFLDTNKVVPNSNYNTQMAKRVGDKIAKAAQQYFVDHKKPDYLSGFAFETNLVESKEVNAWCMPGGKMVVYTGILPVTQTETGLAVVMGHEVSHAIAKHGAERMSNGMLAQGLLLAGQIGLGVAMNNKPQQTQDLWNQIFGLAAPAGAQLGLLANGRNQESEADHLGLIFMAMAGYNPEEAIPFWKRMGALAGGPKPPVILSTHPTDAQRIAGITKFMPEALKEYTKVTGIVSSTKY